MLKEGLVWRVGNGLNINVWEKAWILNKRTAITPSPGPNSNLNLRVADLFDFNCGEWLADMVRPTFSIEESSLILKLPLSSRWPNDIPFWWPTKTGEYTVKSGYWMASIGHINRIRANTSGTEECVWRGIWRMEAPPKLRHFLWRACKGNLAVKENLFQ